MKTRELVSLALLVSIGTVLHMVAPPILFGMKPDMLLTMMFLGIILFPDVRSVLILGSVTGIIAGLTTSFPGGLIANIIDNPISALIFLALFKVVSKFNKSIISVAALTAIGTVISGTIFLTAAYLIVGLPGPFIGLVAGVVLPAAAVNTIVMVVLYPIATKVIERTTVTRPRSTQ